MDAQDFNDLEQNNNNNVYIEGESDIIDEEAEHNLSMEGIRRTFKKGTRSQGELEENEGENEDISQQDFIKGVLADKSLIGNSHLSNRKSIKDSMAKNDDLIQKSDKIFRNSVTMGFELPKFENKKQV